MDNNKLLPTIVAGFAAAVLSTIPGLKNAACCLFIPLATVFSIFLYRKMNNTSEKIKTGTAILFGVMTGIAGAFFATAFDVVITFVTKSNEFVELLPQTEIALRELNFAAMTEQTMGMLRQMAADIKSTGFSALYTFGILLSNIFFYTVFGILGGLLSTIVMNKRSAKSE